MRDKEKREVDFLLLRDRKPWLLAECRLSDATPSPHLAAFALSLSPALVLQITGAHGVHERFDLDAKNEGILVSADAFLGLLP